MIRQSEALAVAKWQAMQPTGFLGDQMASGHVQGLGAWRKEMPRWMRLIRGSKPCETHGKLQLRHDRHVTRNETLHRLLQDDVSHQADSRWSREGAIRQHPTP
jgi:hypothetical protein